MFRRPRRNVTQRRQIRMPARALAVRANRALNSSRPERVGGNKQLLTVPQHSYTFKIQKVFRLTYELVNPTASVDVTISDIRDQVRNELGITAGTNGEAFAIHSARVYGCIRTSGTAVGASYPNQDIDVLVYDIEETAQAPSSSLIDRYNSISTLSGIAHLAFRYPVNNRPTFNRATAQGSFLSIRSNGTSVTNGATMDIYVDLLIDYTRVTISQPLIASSKIRPSHAFDQEEEVSTTSSFLGCLSINK